MSEDISSKVKKIVADHLGIEEGKVTDEASLIDDLVADILDTIGPGQLTRQLEQSVTGVGQATQAFIAGEKSFLEAMSVSFGKIAAQAGSAATRFIDPVNSFAGLVRGSEFQVPNRKI